MDAIALERRNDGALPAFEDRFFHRAGELRLAQENAAREDELHWRVGFSEFAGARHSVLRERLGGTFQNISCDRVAGRCRLEHFHGKGSDVGLGRVLSPANQFIGFIQLQRAEQALTKRRPFAVAVEVVNDRLQRAQADLESAAFVAQHVTPAADLRGLAVAGTTEETGARAAENEDSGNVPLLDPCRAVRSHQGSFEIVRREARNLRPYLGRSAADAFAIRFRARACHADGERVRLGKRRGNLAEAAGQLRVVQQAEIRRTNLSAAGWCAIASVEQPDHSRAACLDAEASGRARVRFMFHGGHDSRNGIDFKELNFGGERAVR